MTICNLHFKLSSFNTSFNDFWHKKITIIIFWVLRFILALLPPQNWLTSCLVSSIKQLSLSHAGIRCLPINRKLEVLSFDQNVDLEGGKESLLLDQLQGRPHLSPLSRFGLKSFEYQWAGRKRRPDRIRPLTSKHHRRRSFLVPFQLRHLLELRSLRIGHRLAQRHVSVATVRPLLLLVTDWPTLGGLAHLQSHPHLGPTSSVLGDSHEDMLDLL